jgi:phage portal protein BeeE
MSRMLDAMSWLLPGRAPQAHVKASAVGPLICWDAPGQPVWSPRDYSAFAREGFMQNAIVYRCVRMIAEAAGSVPLPLYEGADEITEHALLDLMARPSPDHTSADFLESWYGFLLVAGNAYVQAGLKRHLARAARPAPRPHEGDPGPRRLARGLRIHGGRRHRAL